MSENSLLSRLDGIESRFEEVSTLITDPDVIADMKRYVRLSKEYKELEKLTAETRRYKAALDTIDRKANRSQKFFPILPRFAPPKPFFPSL